MSTLTPTQIEQLKRAAKKLCRTSTLTHAQALDRLAMENGYKNWSLLAKHNGQSLVVGVVSSAPASSVPASSPLTTGPSKSKRYYLHGDQAEHDPAKFYCAQCDFLVEAGHFFSEHSPAQTLERCLNSIQRWERRPHTETAHLRPIGAANMLEQPARAAVAAWEAARGPFHRWLERQKGKESIVGDFASDAVGDKNFPIGATTYAEVHAYIERFASNAAMEALKEAWKKFQASVKREEKRMAGSSL